MLLDKLVCSNRNADEFVEKHAMKIVKDDGVEGLARLLAHMPQKQEAIFVATKVLTAKTGFFERD